MKLRWPVLASAVTLAASAVSWSRSALAADPTTADCLAASEASLESHSEHKLQAERSQLLVCAAATCPADIRQECLDRVDEVNKQIPTVLFSVKDGSGADLSVVKVTMDGEVLAERLEGVALSIDPGEHTFTFEAAGHPAMTKKVMIEEAQKDLRVMVAFGAPVPPPRPPPPPPPLGQNPGTQRALAIVAGAVGVVGVGVGSVFGIMAMSKKSDAQSACPDSPCTTADGANKWSSAATAGNISTAGFIVGGLGLAGGAVLWFTAPSSSRNASTQVGVGPGALHLKGTW